jgi:pimeloyl-ACP methyl ester carboxylesterase
MVKELAAGLGLSKFDLVGHSMGGMIALTMALLSPAQVGKLVLVNTPVSGRTALHGRGRMGATYPGLLLVKMGLQIPWILSLLRKMKRYYFVLDPRFTEDANKAPLYSLKSHAEALCRTSLRERLREVAVPTLVMGTEQDGIVRPSEFSLAGENIPGAETVWVRDAGHCPTLEMADESHAAIFNFLKP